MLRLGRSLQRLLRASGALTLGRGRIYGIHRSQHILWQARRFSDRARAVVPSSYSEPDAEVVESIKLLIEKRIRPVVQQDGGDVSFVSYDPETGFVYVRLSGACVGCVQSDITLKHMIQGMLCHYLDEITAVYNCDEEGFVISGDGAETD